MEKIINAVQVLASVCDGAHSRDRQGFNGWDASYVRELLVKEWTERDAYNAWKMLRKYRKQLMSFGIDYDAITPDAYKAEAVIQPKFNPRWGSLMMILQGRIDKDAFTKYVSIHKEMGFKFDGEAKAWYVKKSDLPAYNHAQYVERMAAELNVHVEAVPEQQQEQTERELSVADVVSGIRNKKLQGYVAVTCNASGKFAFHFPFNSVLVDLFSNKTGQLTGITEFNMETKARETFELETVLEAISKIQTLLPDWQVVSDCVDKAVKERNQQIEQDRVALPEVQAQLNPEFSLFPYQNEGVRHLVKTNGNALMGYEMGLGKTLMTLAWVAANGKRALVVVPKVVRRTWLQEATKFFPSYFSGKVAELRSADLKKGGQPDLSNVVLASVNYESLEKFLPAIQAAGFDTIVADESHKMKNPKAKITKTLMALRETFKHRILLSGTAVKNKKIELKTQTDFIQPGLFTKQELHFGTIGGCWNKLRGSIYIARQKKDVLPDLPEKISQIVEMDVTGMPTIPDEIGGMSTALVQAALAKAQITCDFVQEILESSDSCVLVFSESVDTAKKIAETLGDVAILHHGQMSDDRREAAKVEFQNENSSKRVLVSTRQSLAVGATLTRADKVVFNDLPWVSTDIRQAEDRTHRIGQKNCVNVYWMTARNNEWDANLTNIIRRKYSLTKKMNEGKQLTKEEQEWLSKPITLDEIKNSKI